MIFFAASRWKRAILPVFATATLLCHVEVEGFHSNHHIHRSSLQCSSSRSSPSSRHRLGYDRRQHHEYFTIKSQRHSKIYSRINDGDDHDDHDNTISNNEHNNDDETTTPYLDRRKAMAYTGLTMLSLWFGLKGDLIVSPFFSAATWAAETTDQQENQPPKKTILITGCNTGIGFEAARILARQGNTIVMACRTFEKASEAADKILTETATANLIPAECDLSSLDSIKKFVDQLTVNGADAGSSNIIDIACYNAGISLNQFDTEPQRTKDGFELTVGTNHLGHFYLNSLLMSNKKINTSTGKIVVTASAVHDPESPGGAQGKTATLGDLEGFIRDGRNFEMVDGQPYNGDKAYKDSKLCNVFFCRELQRRLSSSSSTKDMTVNSFSPGLITTTGLFRYQSPIFIPIFSFIATKVAKVAETPEWGGAALAYMTTVDTRGQYYNSPPGSSKYDDAAFGNQFTQYEVSKEAQDDVKAKKLWDLSDGLVSR
jgi:protochlorophyllide reductase